MACFCCPSSKIRSYPASFVKVLFMDSVLALRQSDSAPSWEKPTTIRSICISSDVTVSSAVLRLLPHPASIIPSPSNRPIIHRLPVLHFFISVMSSCSVILPTRKPLCHSLIFHQVLSLCENTPQSSPVPRRSVSFYHSLRPLSVSASGFPQCLHLPAGCWLHFPH